MKVQDKAVSEREARAMTEEIDQATGVTSASEGLAGTLGIEDHDNAAMSSEGLKAQQEQLDRARNRGGQIVSTMDLGVPMGETSGVPEVENQSWGIESELPTNSLSETVRSAAELVTDEVELTEAEDFVGAETSTQVQERLEEDRADLVTELGKGSPRDFRLMTASTERLTKEAVTAVDNMIKRGAVHPANLARLKHHMTVALLEDAYGRKFGDRN